MSETDDDKVSQFVAFTGCDDTSRATSYLEMSGGNLETAVGLYMEHEAGNGGGGGGGMPALEPASGGGLGAAAGLGGGGFGGGFGGGAMGPGGIMPDDAATAAAIAAAAAPDDQVRAPDATQRMRLMDDHHHGGPPHMMGMAQHPEYNLMRDIMEQELAASSAFSAGRPPARAAVNAAADAAAAASGSDDDGDEVEEAKSMDDSDDEVEVVGESAAGAGPKGLSDMFAPPKHLMHTAGGFAGARTVAKDSKRWLLVNIQKDSEFSSHALNRDVWRDELVENLIREGFIFWQQMDTSPEGHTYVERYSVQDFPHVAFIDPRTARLMWRKEGWTQERPLTAEGFAEIAMDFCSRNSFDRPPQAPRPGAATSRPTKRPVNEMSEAEQLQAAMRASMATDVDAIAVDDEEVQFMGSSQEEADSKPAAKKQEESKEQEQQPSGPSMVDELLQVPVEDEPSTGGARIQFRMPTGSKVVRKFDPSSSVKSIYAFVAQMLKDEGHDGFVLISGFPPTDLESNMDKTIGESNLAGQAIQVRWKD